MQRTKLPPYQGVAHMATAQTYMSFRGAFVSLVLQVDNTNMCTCGVTGQRVEIVDTPSHAQMTRVSEFICYVDPSSGQLLFHHVDFLDDEFDFEVYRRLIGFVGKFPELF